MKLRRFLRARDGHTAIEYSMIAAFIAIGIVSALGSMGLSLEGLLNGLLPAFADHS